MFFSDKIQIPKNIKKTDEGFLIIPANLARTGVQVYSDNEGGRLERPSSEVFAEDSIKTLKGKSVTNLHPKDENAHSVSVTPTNWKVYEVGTVLEPKVTNDGKYLYSELMIKDSRMIDDILKKVETGESLEISCGYTADIEKTSGINDSGEPFDGIMRNIRHNHVAIVPKGRAGKDVKMLIDSLENPKKEVKKMKINFFDAQIEIADADYKLFVDLETKMKKELDEKQALIDSKESELNKLKEKQKELYDAEQLESIAKEMADVKAICDGLNLDSNNLKVDAMKESIVAKMMPELKEKYSAGSKDYKAALFDSASELAKEHINTNKSQSKPNENAKGFDKSQFFK